jgi:uncharacterized membrane protein YcjF (UPF0283 family)
LLNLIASGQTIKPLSRIINEHGDTVTLFSIQSERELTYQLQVGHDAAVRVKTLEALDSALLTKNITLSERNELLQTQLSETRNERDLERYSTMLVQKQLDAEVKRRKKEHRKKIFFIATTAVVSIIAVTLLLKV